MKRCYILGILAGIAPCMCMGQSATVSKLIKEKQRKMEELEKCMGTTKGLKIAGISTIGVTAVGVAGNIVEAKKIQSLDSDIEKTDKKIDKVQKDIDEKRAEIAEREKRQAEADTAEQAAQEKARQDQECIDTVKQYMETQEAKNRIKTAVDEFGETVQDATESITFDSNNYICETGQKRKDCINESNLNIIMSSYVESQVVKEKCGIDVQIPLKVEAVQQSTTPTEETQFQKTCKELGGQYTTGTFHFEGNTISADVTVHDGCVFQTSDGLEEKCSQLKQHTQYYTHINADKKLCAFISDADLKCIEGKPDCPLLQTTPQPAQQTNVTPGQTPNQTPAAPQPKIGDACSADHATKAVYKQIDGQIKCVATECDTSKGYELAKNASGASQGWCKKIATVKAVTPAEKDCTASVSNASKATIDGGMCRVDTCKDNFKRSADKKSCERVDCKKGTFADYSVNQVTYRNGRCEIDTCNGGFVPSEDKQKCVPYSGVKKKKDGGDKSAEQENVEQISFFSDTKVSLEQGKKLVELWGRENDKQLEYIKGSEQINWRGQDYISYRSENENTDYVFEFDSLEEAVSDMKQREYVETAVCRILNGSPSSGSNFVKCENVSCANWESNVKSIISPIRKTDPMDNINGCRMSMYVY